MNSLLQMMGLGMPQMGDANSLASLFQNQSYGPYRPLQPVQQPLPPAKPAPAPQPAPQAAPQGQMQNPGWYKPNMSMRDFTPVIGAEDLMGLKNVSVNPGFRSQIMGLAGGR